MKLKNINYLVIILTVFIFSGCASKPKITRSGFLNDYTNLRPSEIVKGLLVEKHPSKHIGQYQKFIVDFPVVYFQANEEGTAVDPAALNKIAETFRAKAIEALEVKYEVVDEPAEGVLRIRTAITDVVANKV